MRLLAFALPILLIGVVADLSAQRRGTRGRGGVGAPRPEVPPPEAPAPTKVEHWTAVVGGDVHVGDGRVLRGATVLIGDDKIHAVGHDVEVPEKATILDAKGRVVTPGFVAVRAQGLGVPASVSGEIRDSVNPFDPNMKRALAAGITSYLFTNGSGQATPGGSGAVIKLAYGDMKHMVRADKCAYSMRVPLSAPEWRRLRELIGQAKEHEAKAAAAPAAPTAGAAPGGSAPGGRSGAPTGQRGGAAAAAAPAGTEELLRILKGEAVLWVRLEAGGGGRGGGGGGGADDLDEIRQALQIAHLLGRGVVLDDPITAWVVPDEIAATDSAVVLNPRNDAAPDAANPDRTGANAGASGILAAAGVPVAVTCPSGRFGGAQVGTGGILGQDLNVPQVDAAFAVRGGIDPRDGLRTLTIDAARAIGADRFLGSLEVGKDADVLILDGDPLSYKTFVESALVNGKVVYEKDKESFYSHIKR